MLKKEIIICVSPPSDCPSVWNMSQKDTKKKFYVKKINKTKKKKLEKPAVEAEK